MAAAAAAAAAWWQQQQRNDGSSVAVEAMAGQQWQQGGNSGSGGGGGSGSGSASASTMATKTPAETAMTGGKTTINNQLKVVAATAIEMAMMTAMACAICSIVASTH